MWRAIWDAKNDQVLLLAPFWFLVKLNIFSYVYCPFIFLPSIALLTSCFHFPTGMVFLLIMGESLSTRTIKLCLMCAANIVSRATICLLPLLSAYISTQPLKIFLLSNLSYKNMDCFINLHVILFQGPCQSSLYHSTFSICAKASMPLIY